MSGVILRNRLLRPTSVGPGRLWRIRIQDGSILCTACSVRLFSTSTPRYPRLRPGVGVRSRSVVFPSHTPVAGGQPAVDQSEENNVISGNRPSATAVSSTSTAEQNGKPTSEIQAKPLKQSTSRGKPSAVLVDAHDIWRAQSIYLEAPPSTTQDTPPSPTPRSRLASRPQPSPRPKQPPKLVLTASLSPSHAAAGTFFAAHRSTHLYSASALRTHRINSTVPEVALVGASNCGKSSFLNALVRRSGLARTSARAGHTTMLNAYGVGPAPSAAEGAKLKARIAAGKRESVPTHGMVLVDTPGYGFKSQKDWGEGIMAYLRGRTMLRGVVCLVAVEKDGLSRLDEQVLRMVAGLGREVLVVLTKGDKLARGLGKKKGKGNGTGKEGDATAAEEEEDRLQTWATDKMKGVLKAVRRACRDAPQGTLVPRVYLTAADMVKAEGTWKNDPQGNNRGVAGVRLAVLEMAGLTDRLKIREKGAGKGNGQGSPKTKDDLPPEARSNESSPEAWAGETISFEELEERYQTK